MGKVFMVYAQILCRIALVYIWLTMVFSEFLFKGIEKAPISKIGRLCIWSLVFLLMYQNSKYIDSKV